MEVTTLKRLHFIGIGGIGMSALARYCLAMGKKVTGSDSTESDITNELKNEGVKMQIGHVAKNVSKETEAIIYTQAVDSKNPEFREAQRLRIPMYSYAQLLGEITKTKFTVAVCGTHGKSTTTAMVALMMVEGGLDPTVIVGTKLKEFGNRNFRLGKSNFLVIEADEYRRSFLNYSPSIVVLTNVDLDHLDYYRNEADYVKAFKQFAKSIPHTGYLIAPENCKHLATIAKSNKGELLPVTFQKTSFSLHTKKWNYIAPQVPGTHNLHNAALAFAAGKVLDIPERVASQALQQFAGTWRRFENKGRLKTGALCFDDYGHHPTEIRATLQGARALFPKERIICVFQPHQYSRTYLLLKEFATAFKDADLVIIPDIYAARDTEKDKQKINVGVLVAAIQKKGSNVINGYGLKKTAHWLLNNTTRKDVVLTMGAGDITSIYNELPTVLKKK